MLAAKRQGREREVPDILRHFFFFFKKKRPAEGDLGGVEIFLYSGHALKVTTKQNETILVLEAPKVTRENFLK